MTLVGRRTERATLDQFVEAMRSGESRTLVVSGEAGVGKTALLEYLARAGGGMSRMQPAMQPNEAHMTGPRMQPVNAAPL
jgi:predicted ATPase